MRVLLIEDDTVIGSAVREQIEEGGHSVDWAQRLDAAQDALDSAAFDLILLDLMLPDGRGIAFLKGLRARGVQVPVLILTALDQISDRIEGLNAGADDYLSNPLIWPNFLPVSARSRGAMRATLALPSLGAIWPLIWRPARPIARERM